MSEHPNNHHPVSVMRKLNLEEIMKKASSSGIFEVASSNKIGDGDEALVSIIFERRNDGRASSSRIFEVS